MKKLLLIVTPSLLLMLGACTQTRQAAVSTTNTLPNSTQRTVVEIAASSPEHNTLIEAVNTVGLSETLQGAGPFTIFAPTDAAFAKLADDLDWDEENRNQMDLDSTTQNRTMDTQNRTYDDTSSTMQNRDMNRTYGDTATNMQNRTYQDTSSTMQNRDMNQNRDTATTMQNRTYGDTATTMQNRDRNMPTRTYGDTSTMNQNRENRTYQDTSMMQNRTTQDRTYNDNTNAARMGRDTTPGARDNRPEVQRKASAVLLPENQANLKTILQYHVVRGNYDAQALAEAVRAGNGSAQLTTVQGEKLTITMRGNDFVLEDTRGAKARITTADLKGSNGVIHVVDKVALPVKESIMER
ncbi:MAG: fasciclin domain-containing protein [Saprospiraceae bacterium]